MINNGICRLYSLARWIVVFTLAFMAYDMLSYRLAVRAFEKPGPLEVEGLIIRDRAGLVRVRLEVRPDGAACLSFLNQKKKTRMQIGLGRDSDGATELSGITLLDDQERPRLDLEVGGDGSTMIASIGAKGEPRSQLSILPNGTVQQFYYGNDLKHGLKFLVRPTGRSEISLFENGDDRIRMTVFEGGAIRHSLLDHKGVERIMSNIEDDIPSIMINDSNREPRVSIFLDPNGTATQLWYSRARKRASGIYAFSDGNSRQVFFGSNDHRLLELSTNTNLSSVMFYDRQGNSRIGMGIREGDVPFVVPSPKELGK